MWEVHGGVLVKGGEVCGVVVWANAEDGESTDGEKGGRGVFEDTNSYQSRLYCIE